LRRLSIGRQENSEIPEVAESFLGAGMATPRQNHKEESCPWVLILAWEKMIFKPGKRDEGEKIAVALSIWVRSGQKKPRQKKNGSSTWVRKKKAPRARGF